MIPASAAFAMTVPENVMSRRALDSFFTLLVILVSGNPVVLAWQPQAVYVGLLWLLVCVAAIRRFHTVGVTELTVAAAFAGISFLHVAALSTSVLSATAGFWVRFLIALLAVRIVDQFHLRYLRVIYLLAIVSLFFYGAQQLLALADFDLRAAVSSYTFLSDGRVHIGFHNFHLPEEAHRNSGMFWEPGAFAGFLLLGIVLLAGYKEDCYSKRLYRRVLFVLTLAVLTTLSSAGYLLLPLALALHLAPRLRNMTAGLRALSIAVILSLAGGVLAAIYSELPFVFEKIAHQMEVTTKGVPGAELTRFGSIVYDLEFIQSRPLTGWSPHHEARDTLDPYAAEILAGHGNGLTGFVVKFGLLGLLVFATATYLTFSRVFVGSKLRALFSSALVVAMLNGEAFLNYPLLMAFMFPISYRFSTSRRNCLIGLPETRAA